MNQKQYISLILRSLLGFPAASWTRLFLTAPFLSFSGHLGTEAQVVAPCLVLCTDFIPCLCPFVSMYANLFQ